MSTYVGVDGCKAGWFSIGLDDEGHATDGVHPTFQELLSRWSNADMVFVDIPIGLPDSPNPRRCDVEARRLLEKRRSSVFPAPCRAALSGTSYHQASQLNHDVSGRRLTLQTWAILGKVREVDKQLRGNPKARLKVREVHPELLFWGMNEGRAMAWSKKRSVGRDERIRLLERFLAISAEYLRDARQRYKRSEVQTDDMIDAMVAAMTAQLARGEYRTCPSDPDHDEYGLPMEMVYWQPGQTAHPSEAGRRGTR